MRRLILILFVFSGLIYAQNFNGVKIYINPGHGGHDSDDRYIPQTGFWESEGNLSKGLFLRDYLLQMGANVRMSRTTNTSADDLPLSVIDADANNFDADYFHSIHSNAYDGRSDYTIVFYKEKNGSAVFPQAKKMAGIMAQEIYKADRTTKYRVSGDYSFLGFNLGVLRYLNMPGTLSEGSFHDYIPESWRLMSLAYRKNEALAIARSFVAYYNLSPLSVGAVAGILRDSRENVNYFYISSLNDGKRPVNNFTVTLLPDSIVFKGDSFNNGFYFFDSLKPGNYTAIVNAEDYYPDTFNVTASANKTLFYDRYLESHPNLSPPEILAFSPDTSAKEVSLLSKIILEFNVRMNTSSVLNNFTITPAFSGSVKWEDNDKRLTVTPANKLSPGVTYHVHLAGALKSYFGVQMGKNADFYFTTRGFLKLLRVYPDSGYSDISRTVLIEIFFNAGVNGNSLTGKIYFKDSNQKDVPIYVDNSQYLQGIIKFYPIKPLNYSSYYYLSILNGIEDVEGLKFNGNKTIRFKTTGKRISTGKIIDSLETSADWIDPDVNNLSAGLSKTESYFKIQSNTKYDGKFAGELKCKFLSDSGLCVLSRQSPLLISSNGSGTLGMWLFGDLSGNILSYRFSDEKGNVYSLPIDTLSWTGWKFFNVDLSLLNLGGKVFFEGLTIKKTKEGADESIVIIDDIQSDVIVSVNLQGVPEPRFYLSQNYPNPFNPSTVIEYSIPELSVSKGLTNRQNFETIPVELKIYDLLGREITTLVNKLQKPGRYKVIFNPDNLPSGIYFYRLRAGNFISVKKMILLK